jgi:hypothetical protein
VSQRIDEQPSADAVHNTPELSPSCATAAPRRRKWILLGAAGGLLLIGLVFYPMTSEADVDVSDLPEWFGRVHRIRQPPSPAHSVPFVPGLGNLLTPKDTGPSDQLTSEVFENEFTHYMGSNAFVWATPRNPYPAHGKILAGIKVIVGKEVDEMTLICLRTKDGKPLNMFIQGGALRHRAQGPPPQQDD